MRKLLAFFGTCILGATSATGVVSCSTDDNGGGQAQLQGHFLNAEVESAGMSGLRVDLLSNFALYNELDFYQLKGADFKVVVDGNQLSNDQQFSAELNKNSNNFTIKIFDASGITSKSKITVAYKNEKAMQVSSSELTMQFRKLAVVKQDSVYVMTAEMNYFRDINSTDLDNFSVYENNNKLTVGKQYYVASLSSSTIQINFLTNSFNINDKYYLQYKNELKTEADLTGNFGVSALTVEDPYTLSFNSSQGDGIASTDLTLLVAGKKVSDFQVEKTDYYSNNYTIKLTKGFIISGQKVSLQYKKEAPVAGKTYATFPDMDVSFSERDIDFIFYMPTVTSDIWKSIRIFQLHSSFEFVANKDFTIGAIKNNEGSLHFKFLVSDIQVIYKNGELSWINY